METTLGGTPCPYCRAGQLEVLAGSWNQVFFTCDLCKRSGVYSPEVEALVAACSVKRTSAERLRSTPDLPSLFDPSEVRRSVPPSPSTLVQQKLGLDPGRPTSKIKMPEKENQGKSMSRACRGGYKVWQTTVRLRAQRCEHCKEIHRYNPVLGRGENQTTGYGTTPGIADLLIRHPEWFPSVCCQIEIKGTDTPVSDVQAEEEREGHIFISRHPDETMYYVQAVDRALRPAAYAHELRSAR